MLPVLRGLGRSQLDPGSPHRSDRSRPYGRQLDLGNEPFIEGRCAYLGTERAAGQFLGMIADFVFWPRMLVVDYAPSEAEMYRAVDEAVETMIARYAVD